MQYLWVDSYRPQTLEGLTYHEQITQVLGKLASTNDFPHIILHGPEGVGKKTRAYAFMNQIFGQAVHRIKIEEKTLKLENTSIEYTMLQSNHHIELTPADNEYHDRHIIQNVVKQIANSLNVEGKTAKPFKVVIINESDRLSREAQGGLRRTMEKYMKTCRMILICNHVHKLILPIRSRCLNIRIPIPTKQDVVKVLQRVSSKVGHQFSQELISQISDQSEGNMRLAIIQLQLSRQSKTIESTMAPFRKQIKQISHLLFKEQTPAQLKKIRDKFYDLLVNCIDGGTILRQLLSYILRWDGIDEGTVKQIIHQASRHENTLLCGSKAIYHLESFTAHIMQIIMAVKNRMVVQ